MIIRLEKVNFRSSDFHIHTTNRRNLNPVMHNHEFYEITAVISGACSQIINGQSNFMTVNDVAFLRPNDTHQFCDQTPDANLLTFSIKCQCVERFLAAYGKIVTDFFAKQKSIPILNLEDQGNSIFAKAYSALASPDAQTREMYCNTFLGGIFQLLISKIVPAQLNSAYTDDRGAPSPIDDSLRQMSDPILIAEGIPALQRISGYSRPQLCRIFKEYYGITPYEYIREQRMNLAHSLVLQSDLSVATISEHVGYLNNSHFISEFKTEYGMTPLQLRKDHLKSKKVIQYG